MKYADLSTWLENDAAHHCVIEERGDKKNLVKIPYDDDFDFLYYQRVCNGNNLSRTQAFYYCGIYNKLDGRLYDLQSVLKVNCLILIRERRSSRCVTILKLLFATLSPIS